jgi:hypothetical protein
VKSHWPLGLGKRKNKDEVTVIERERVGVIVKEDLPLTVYRYLSDSIPVEPHFATLDILLWTLCDTTGAFPVVDIIQDQARRFNFKATLDEPSEATIIARLQGIEDLDGTVRIILDLVAGLE